MEKSLAAGIFGVLGSLAYYFGLESVAVAMVIYFLALIAFEA